jgi:peptidoglycan/xylan/chitin deacetylase (PgdA/CDA1 family)
LPFLWLYPNNLPAIGHLSHDTDGNGPDEARGLLETLKAAGIHSTWCVIEPGYAPDLMYAIRDAGHEFAMHYDAMSDERPWGEVEFTRQWKFLVSLFEGEHPVSNKNHYLRWEGDTEFYNWCERHGIQLDQSKGASKTGEAGYNFGTCHPFFPLAPDGTPHDVLEMATPTQDLCVFAPEALLEPLLTAALRHHGILHLLFHPAHIFKPGVADALIGAVAKAQERGMAWWTAEEINRWERARRAVRWRDYQLRGDGVSVTLETPDSLPGATVLWLLPSDVPKPENAVMRWRRRFLSVPLSSETNAACSVTAHLVATNTL